MTTPKDHDDTDLLTAEPDQPTVEIDRPILLADREGTPLVDRPEPPAPRP